MVNNDIRIMARTTGVPFWRIAEELGISEPSMTRKLRHELTDDEKVKICEIINKFKSERRV